MPGFMSDPRPARRVPVHARHPADHVSRPAVDDAAVRRLRHADRVQRPLPISAGAGRQRPERRLRSADADGLRLRPSAGRGRGRQGWRRHRFARRHGGAVRRHSARPRLDVDDHQRDGRHPAGAVHRRGAAPGRRPLAACRGTIQNDILKEYVARGTYIYPPRASLRIVTDIFAYCARELPNWNTISISGYHIREAGSTAVQEVAFTFAQRHRLRAGGVDAGLDVNSSASGCRSSSTRTTTSSRRSRSSARPGGCGRASCATGSARRTRARSSCGSTPRPPAAR